MALSKQQHWNRLYAYNLQQQFADNLQEICGI